MRSQTAAVQPMTRQIPTLALLSSSPCSPHRFRCHRQSMPWSPVKCHLWKRRRQRNFRHKRQEMRISFDSTVRLIRSDVYISETWHDAAVRVTFRSTRHTIFDRIRQIKTVTRAWIGCCIISIQKWIGHRWVTRNKPNRCNNTTAANLKRTRNGCLASNLQQNTKSYCCWGIHCVNCSASDTRCS